MGWEDVKKEKRKKEETKNKQKNKTKKQWYSVLLRTDGIRMLFSGFSPAPPSNPRPSPPPPPDPRTRASPRLLPLESFHKLQKFREEREIGETCSHEYSLRLYRHAKLNSRDVVLFMPTPSPLPPAPPPLVSPPPTTSSPPSSPPRQFAPLAVWRSDCGLCRAKTPIADLPRATIMF